MRELRVLLPTFIWMARNVGFSCQRSRATCVDGANMWFSSQRQRSRYDTMWIAYKRERGILLPTFATRRDFTYVGHTTQADASSRTYARGVNPRVVFYSSGGGGGGWGGGGGGDAVFRLYQLLNGPPPPPPPDKYKFLHIYACVREVRAIT